MLSKKIKYFLTLLLLISGVVSAQNKTAVEPWFFIQITDPQFGMFDNNQGFEKETILYEKAVEKINNLKPDFVVITGDFVHNSLSPEQIAEFKRITALIDPGIPVYLTPGNHDIGQTPDQESLRKYRSNFGSDRFSFSHKGSSFIGFNSSIIKAGLTEPEQEQYNWLENELKQSRNAQHIILFCHYPLFIKTPDEPESYSNLAPASRKKYLTLFENYGVDAVFSGHYHNNSIATYGKIQLVTTSALGKPLGTAPSGLRIVKVYGNRIEHEYFGFEEIPDTVKF